VNPEIVKVTGERTVDEGCLSVPGYRAELTRHQMVIAKGIDPETGKEVRIKSKDDLLAQALEHEIDHTNGILYMDHLPSLDVLVKIGEEEAGSRR
jgi:peptide deformylase